MQPVAMAAASAVMFCENMPTSSGESAQTSPTHSALPTSEIENIFFI